MWILLGVLVAAVIYVIAKYNYFVSTKARIKASIQEIGNQLKRQASLIPNLEESAKGYLKHEKDVFRMLTDARKAVTGALESGDLAKMSAAGQKVAEALGSLRVVLESNPQIKGADVITRLMDELRDTADKLMYSRRTLIDLTADYNVALANFPGNLVAQVFGFQPEKGLETPLEGSHLAVSAEEMKDQKVNLS